MRKFREHWVQAGCWLFLGVDVGQGMKNLIAEKTVLRRRNVRDMRGKRDNREAC